MGEGTVKETWEYAVVGSMAQGPGVQDYKGLPYLTFQNKEQEILLG